jgi:hypothetical protein
LQAVAVAEQVHKTLAVLAAAVLVRFVLLLHNH